VIDQNLTDVAATDEQRDEPLGRLASRFAEARQRPLEQRYRRESRERRLLRRLPDRAVAADQRQRRVPGPDRNGEVECRNDAGDAKRVPALHHPVLGAFGRNRQAIELPRQANGEIADVDHLLDFAKPFGGDLSDLDRHQPSERGLADAEFLTEQPDELAAFRSRDRPPLQERRVGFIDRASCAVRVGLADMGDDFARDGRAGRQRAAGMAQGVDTKLAEQPCDLGA
jgi:hypothetical protein